MKLSRPRSRPSGSLRKRSAPPLGQSDIFDLRVSHFRRHTRVRTMQSIASTRSAVLGAPVRARTAAPARRVTALAQPVAGYAPRSFE